MNLRKAFFGLTRRHKGALTKLANNVDFNDQFLSKRHNGAYIGPTREALYRHLNDVILENGPTDLLEFGVYRGESLKRWTEYNTHPASRFFGFDSFQGLPEDWGVNKKGTFDVAGVLPDIADTRIHFVPGRFQNTLRTFLSSFVPTSRLVIHMDADLYSSTLYCLTTLDQIITQGTIIAFDDFGDLEHEYAAFRDFARSYYRKYKVLCHVPNFSKVAVEIL